MKKVIFGSALMISGMIGFVGWTIAETLERSSGRSGLAYVFGYPLAIFFFIVSILGMVIAISGLKGDK